MEWPTDPSAVVSLDGWRKRRDRERLKEQVCQHERYILDTENGVVECATCGAPVSAFYALKKIAFHESKAFTYLSGMKKEIAELASRQNWLRAVRALDRIWRGKKMLPCCPHCKRGLFAEDFDGSAVGIEYERARRLTATNGAKMPRNDVQPLASCD